MMSGDMGDMMSGDMGRARTRGFRMILVALACVGLAACSDEGLASWLGETDNSAETPPADTAEDPSDDAVASTAPSEQSDATSGDDTESTDGAGPIDAVRIDDASIAERPIAVTIDRVVDGDSLEVLIVDELVELRLEGYNAPELYADGVDGAADYRTCNGIAAKEGLEKLIATATEPPMALVSELDRFGRTLGDLAIDGYSAVGSMVSAGYGLATGDSDSHRELMWSAAEQRRGVWGDQCPRSEVLLRIGDVRNDPDGNDRFNLTEEWVEVVNADTTAQSLDRWVLRDDTTGHQFELAGTLDPGATLTVRSGGDPTDSELTGSNPTMYLGESYPVWSNSGETVILTDPTGAFVDWRFISPD